MLDEAQAIKNPASDTAQELRRIRAPGDLMTRISALIASARGADPNPS